MDQIVNQNGTKSPCQTCDMLNKKLQNFVHTQLDGVTKTVLDSFCSGQGGLNSLLCRQAGEQVGVTVEGLLKKYLNEFSTRCSQNYFCTVEDTILQFYKKDTF